MAHRENLKVYFNSEAERLLSDFEDLIELLPDKGDKCSDSQKICLRQALFELSSNINGLEDNDFIQE